jgi:DNA polymerase III epsilon subunit-like protein|tara:strand:+ start:1687 stop:3273 length:1587 start_codon:yes stop_codon:yes gene_type:complete
MFNLFRRKPASVTPDSILQQILCATPKATSMAPKDSRGVYGLVDHLGDLRYIGSTRSAAETFYKRIHQRHRTGSETTSHYFSRMYNTGRMWRLRNDPATKADGDIAKKLRNAFIAEHCRAVWVPLSDELDIAGLEAAVIELAPKEVVAWNRRGMEAYEEPVDLVDHVIDQLKFSTVERAALDRQRARFGGSAEVFVAPVAPSRPRMQRFPEGPFRFVTLDVETANNDRSSICQIGVACVRPNNSIETWVTYIDPQTSRWVFTGLHGISAATVNGSPTIAEVLPILEKGLRGLTVYQHSGFDRSAVRAACTALSRPEPEWNWQDSVAVARRAWPELRGNGGHGLASLKRHLGLSFEHHDAGEDARAAAEVVLQAEGLRASISADILADEEDFDVIERPDAPETPPKSKIGSNPAGTSAAASPQGKELVGFSVITNGNLNNNHFYLREVWTAFPEDCIGGANMASAAPCSLTVLWGSGNHVITDLDGKKKLFRKRGWVRGFFTENNAQEGDRVAIHRVNLTTFEVSVLKM